MRLIKKKKKEKKNAHETCTKFIPREQPKHITTTTKRAIAVPSCTILFIFVLPLKTNLGPLEIRTA